MSKSNRQPGIILLAILATIQFSLHSALAQGTAFTYQGRLNANGVPASGIYDLRFAIYDSSSGGTQEGGALTNFSTAVSNGLFTVTLDFGNQFPGADRWLEIGVRTNGGNAFATLTPRQQITPTPYAVRANTAASASSVAATNITGTIPVAQLPANVITNGASGVNFSGTFSGNGAGITNVNVSTLQQHVGIPVAWGDNGNGETTIPGGLSSVATIAAGGFHGLALNSDGTVAVWGDNSSGQTTIPAGLSNVVAIAGGEYHSLALKSDGTVVAWGFNFYGQTTIPVGLSNVVAIAGGGLHSLALKSDGTVAAWGRNNAGQTTIPVGLSNVVAIAAGGLYSLALKSDGTVAAWGDNSYGQTTIPVGLSNVVAIAGGFYHSLALKSDGTVAAWGRNNAGQTTIPVGLSNVVAIAGGGLHSLALKSDGTVAAWGDNGYGQTTIPVGLTNVVAIAGGFYHSLALRPEVIPAQIAFLNVNNVFQGTVTAAGFIGSLGATNAYTPTIGNGSANFITSIASGYYAKMGNLVYFETWLTWYSKGSASSGNLVVSLPFQVASARAVYSIGYVDGINYSGQMVPISSGGTSQITIFSVSSGGPTAIPVTSCAASGEIQVTGWYRWQ
jgi:hypothetical protein